MAGQLFKYNLSWIRSSSMQLLIDLEASFHFQQSAFLIKESSPLGKGPCWIGSIVGSIIMETPQPDLDWDLSSYCLHLIKHTSLYHLVSLILVLYVDVGRSRRKINSLFTAPLPSLLVPSLNRGLLTRLCTPRTAISTQNTNKKESNTMKLIRKEKCSLPYTYIYW